MTTPRRIKIAGPQNELKIGPVIEHARTHLFVRQRVRDALQDAPPHSKRQSVKATRKWPGTLSTDVL